MYEKLRFWSKHHNREMLHEGMAAVESFLKQISESLVEKAKQGKKEGGVFKVNKIMFEFCCHVFLHSYKPKMAIL